jgi:ATP-dependent DNA helicase RecG
MTDSRPGYFSLTYAETPSLGLESLEGIGPKRAERLRAREIGDAEDLLLFAPRKYRRAARFTTGRQAAEARAGFAELCGRIDRVNAPPAHSRRPLEVHVVCGDQPFKLLWFNLPYRGFAKKLEPGRWVTFSGEVDWDGGIPSVAHPSIDLSSSKPPTPEARVELEPVYVSMEGIPDATLRGAIEQAASRLLPLVRDAVPADLLERRGLPRIREALEIIHLLGDSRDRDSFEDELRRARQRLVYEEFFSLQLALAEAYVRERRAARAPQCTERDLGRALVRNLPFELTDDQKKAASRLAEDVGRRMPMRRLLQGDVGSGKTVVAFMACAITIDNGCQAAFMAPTDILAQQHLETARELFGPLDVEVASLTGSMPEAKRRETLERLADGSIDLIIGTHALFTDDVTFDALGMVVVDEQHKFGVDQREALLAKGRDPHLLAMTATPIPRSLAHSVFGDLDLTVIREKPPGRLPVRTFLRTRQSASKVYEYVQERIEETGQQAFFVYPMVEESEKAPGRRSAVDSAEALANGPLAGLRVAILHGQMPDDVKTETMRAFADGRVDVLCATTVVEVGMDVPNATMMVIESPEVFGLSQLHQLRGRVGRSQIQSMCVLLAGYGITDDAEKRLTHFAGTDDGFELAEVDLEIRGPGQFLGERQSGRAEFRFGDLIDDAELLEAARRDARERILGDAGR